MTALDRPGLVSRISEALCRRSYPRLQMALMVMATGCGGFLASVAMLHCGLDRMWIRYPLSVAIGYGVFLLLLRLWIGCQQRDRSATQDALDLADLVPTDFPPGSHPARPPISSDSGTSSGWSDGGFALDGDEWIAVIALLVALVVGMVASVLIVFSAPALLGEVFLDAVVMVALRKRVRGVAGQHWTVGVVRRTTIPFLTVALVFALAGGVIQQVRPGVKSIGGILHAERVGPAD
ncbi:MAG: hypothetical protein ACYDC1_18715 [Limisphaerales bacterium]